jgi:Zn ribbon nucleic-acid-binding protein
VHANHAVFPTCSQMHCLQPWPRHELNADFNLVSTLSMSVAISPLIQISIRAEHITPDRCPACWHYDFPQLVTDSTSLSADRRASRALCSSDVVRSMASGPVIKVLFVKYKQYLFCTCKTGDSLQKNEGNNVRPSECHFNARGRSYTAPWSIANHQVKRICRCINW